MTPQERAAALLDKVQSALTPIWLGGRQRMLLEREIAEALTATRRAALLEARQAVLGEHLSAAEIYSTEDEVYNDAIDDALGAIDRLAQEG